MVQQLDAVYEGGVLRPLEPLVLAEHQRVRVTVEGAPPSAAPTQEYASELEWLAREARPYAGQWVALDGGRLLAHGPKLAAVKAAAEAAGFSHPFLASVPDDDAPFGGW